MGTATPTTRSAQTPDGVDHGTVATRLGYEPIVVGDTSGWTLRQATTTTTQMGSGPSAADLTTTTSYTYNRLGQVTTATDTSGTTTRTTTSSYDPAGRTTGTSITTTGLTGSPPPARDHDRLLDHDRAPGHHHRRRANHHHRLRHPRPHRHLHRHDREQL